MKKFFNFLILVSIVLTSALCFSQTKEEVLLKDANFEIMKKKAIELYTSYDYIDYKKKNDEFNSKLPQGINKNTNDFENKILDKISNSKFINSEEAISQYKVIKELDIKFDKLESEIFKLKSDLSERYGRTIVSELYNQEINKRIIEIQLGL
jgi:hypothetical protein